MKQMGVGLAAAILLDAFVIRVVVLPALMTVLGRANWWPSKLSRPMPATEVEPRRPHPDLVHSTPVGAASTWAKGPE